MTATEVTRLKGHHVTFPPDRAGHNDNHGSENHNTCYDRRISKADSPKSLTISIENLNVDKTNVTSTSTTFTAATTTTTTEKPEYPPLRTEYGDQWEWDAKLLDYVRCDEKGRHLYTNYQKPEAETAQTKSSPTSPAKQAVPKPPVAWQGVLDDRFQVVSKPKRFFSVGRIFKVAWFEPRGSDTPVRRSNSGPDWASDCPAFYGEKPVAKFRWFVIVRRRLHHSLCFSITTYSKNAANKTTRGRDLDYVVMYSSFVEPARPYPEENITRNPIAVIIEDGETFIAPIARLDLGRIYTVEDNLKIMKVGRVHPSSLDDLEEYYKHSVL